MFLSVTISRKAREKEERKRAILSAARSVFSHKGYAKSTLDEIAATAEFGKGTLYNYFDGGKQELLFTIIEEMYDDVHRLITSHFNAPDIDQQPVRTVLRDLIQKMLTYYGEQRDTFMILVKEVQRLLINADEKAEYFMRQRNRLIEALEGPLERAMAAGEIRKLPPRAVAHMLLGNIHGCQMHMFLEKAATDDGDGDADCAATDNAEFLTTMLLDGLLEEKTVPTQS